MNAKKIKALRKFCRENGIDPKDVSYDVQVHTKATIHGSVFQRYQFLLNAGCGRAIYKKWKKIKAKHLKRR